MEPLPATSSASSFFWLPTLWGLIHPPAIPSRRPISSITRGDALRARDAAMIPCVRAVESLRAAGIAVVASAGNSGSSCSTVADPPGIYEASFTVGATDSADTIASFSSRGPVTVDGSNRLKPDISAPGVNIRSAVRNNAYGSMSGTSMAAPHVAGAVALLWSGVPDLIGNIDDTESLLKGNANTSLPYNDQTCGGIPGTQLPNNTYGAGRLDIYSTVQTHLATLHVYKDGAGSGTVTSDPAGIDCGLICSAGFTRGDTVTLTAAPAAGSIFYRMER